MNTKILGDAAVIGRNNSTAIGYSGKITVSVQAGDRIISKKEYHNAGSILLFNFLCACLAGDYTSADGLRPTAIKLFNVNTASYNTPSAAKEYLSTIGYTESGTDFAGITAASSLISSNKAANIGTGTDRNMVTLHFRVPYALITQDSINMIGLYRRQTSGNTNWSAYYLFTTGTGEQEQWAPLGSSSAQNYNLLIEWTMTVDNAG